MEHSFKASYTLSIVNNRGAVVYEAPSKPTAYSARELADRILEVQHIDRIEAKLMVIAKVETEYQMSIEGMQSKTTAHVVGVLPIRNGKVVDNDYIS